MKPLQNSQQVRQGPPEPVHGPSGDHIDLLGVDGLHHSQPEPMIFQDYLSIGSRAAAPRSAYVRFAFWRSARLMANEIAKIPLWIIRRQPDNQP
jgi:hypothetical protein